MLLEDSWWEVKNGDPRRWKMEILARLRARGSYPKHQGHHAGATSQLDLVPLAIQAAQLLQINGYDQITDTASFGKRDINRILPIIYSTWAKKSSNVLGSAKEIIKRELDVVLGELYLDFDELAKYVREAQDKVKAPVGSELIRCRIYWDNSTTLGEGLVQPCRIAFDKRREVEYRYSRTYSRHFKAGGIVPARPVVATGDIDIRDIEEEFFRERKEDIE